MIDEGGPDGFYCTGLLVATDVVITARHCIFGGQTRFLIGADAEQPDAVIASAGTVVHDTLDLAILVLAEPVSDIAVPISISEEMPTSSWIGRDVVIAGFGQTEDGSMGHRGLLREHVIRVDADSVTIAGEGESGACLGDSGGPLLVTSGDGAVTTAGVLSKGSSSCIGIDIYVRLDVVRDWLLDNGALVAADSGRCAR